jgi:hypothetical protein
MIQDLKKSENLKVIMSAQATFGTSNKILEELFYFGEGSRRGYAICRII